jgi:hypothetical protein
MVSNISTANGIATAVERGSSRIAHAGDAIAGAIEKLAVKVENAAETIGQRITMALHGNNPCR